MGIHQKYVYLQRLTRIYTDLAGLKCVSVSDTRHAVQTPAGSGSESASKKGNAAAPKRRRIAISPRYKFPVSAANLKNAPPRANPIQCKNGARTVLPIVFNALHKINICSTQRNVIDSDTAQRAHFQL